MQKDLTLGMLLQTFRTLRIKRKGQEFHERKSLVQQPGSFHYYTSTITKKLWVKQLI